VGDVTIEGISLVANYRRNSTGSSVAAPTASSWSGCGSGRPPTSRSRPGHAPYRSSPIASGRGPTETR